VGAVDAGHDPAGEHGILGQVRADHQDGAVEGAQQCFGDAAHDRPGEAAAPVRGHAHEGARFEALDDAVGDALDVHDLGLEVGGGRAAVGEAGQVLGGLLLVVGQGTAQRPHRDAGAGGEVERGTQGPLGDRRPVEGNEDVGERCLHSRHGGSSRRLR
jgi:hypothetical protein